MASTVAWLDVSPEDERRARELIAMYSQPESRDELGVGQIRDVLSNQLFPGISSIQTRARYFLIVPWIFRSLATRGYSGDGLLARANAAERRLVVHLIEAGEADGLIGRLRGAAVKVLPSQIYWGGLRTFGILRNDRSRERMSAISTSRVPESDELAERTLGDWVPTLPTAPNDFPNSCDGGLQLTASEATWLREQIMETCGSSLLGFLAGVGDEPSPDSWGPWDEPMCATAPAEIRSWLTDAQLFSLAMQGAGLLYSLQVGERYENEGLTGVQDPVSTLRSAYEDWVLEVAVHEPDLARWKTNDFWQRLLAISPRISPTTKQFVSTWLRYSLEGRAAEGPEDTALRELVADRERTIKRSQSRLVNERLLESWNGESGTGRQSYRWRQAHRILRDIADGRNRADA